VIPITGHYPYVDEDPNFLKYLVVGPMARYAEDLRPMVKVLAGENAEKLRLDEKVSRYAKGELRETLKHFCRWTFPS